MMHHQLTHSPMIPLCGDGGWVPGDGDVMSQTMCLKCRTISDTCRWFRTETKTNASSLFLFFRISGPLLGVF